MNKNEAEHVIRNTIDYANNEIRKTRKRYRIMISILFIALLLTGLAALHYRKTGKEENADAIRYLVTNAETRALVLEGEEGEKFGYSSSDEWKYGLYERSWEIDRKVTVSIHAITVCDEGGERIEKVWIDTNPENSDRYITAPVIVASSCENKTICIVGCFRLNDLNQTDVHMTLVLDSLFE